MSMQGQNMTMKMMKAKGGKELQYENGTYSSEEVLTVRQDILSKWGKKWK
jgi:hypothetical protein